MKGGAECRPARAAGAAWGRTQGDGAESGPAALGRNALGGAAPRGAAALLAVAVATLQGLAGCGARDPDRPDWVIHSQLVFRTEDLSLEQPPLPPGQFRLAFPFVSGDLYGPPTTGDYLHPVLEADYRFHIDLNRSHKGLLASLAPTELSLRYLRIDPAGTRIARLEPLLLEADGIEPLGRLEWLDPDSHRTLMLLYVDRPAAIAGTGKTGGRPVRYAIRTASAGYLWVEKISGDSEDLYSAVPQPPRLLLAAALPSPDSSGWPGGGRPAGRTHN